MKNKVYIVTAYRYGNRADHSYNIGVFQKKSKAKQVAESHCTYRNGKYDCVVDECKLNKFDNDDADDYTKEIYRASPFRGANYIKPQTPICIIPSC